MLPIELINVKIRNTKAYKEYYACTTGEATPKPKASARRKRSGSNTSITPPTAITTPTTTVAITPRLTTAAKGKQPAKAKSPSDPSELGGSVTDEGIGSKPGVPDVPSDDSEEELSWNSSNDEDTDAQEKDGDDDEGDERGESDDGEEDDAKDKDESESDEESDGVEIREEESFDPIPRTPEDSEDEDNEDDGNGKEDKGLRISEEERLNEEEESVNAQLEAEVLTKLSHSSRTSYVVSADLSEMELKKILIEKMEGNKSIQRSNEQRNLYKALVDAYEADKTILDSYGDTVILKRRRDDDDDDQEEGPSTGSDRGSKRRREGKEPESASAPLETTIKSTGRSTTGSKSRQVSASESAFAEEPVQTISQMDEPSYPVFETGADNQTIVQSSQHPEWISQPKKAPDSGS
nr:hypothetical protein [Tanacetum cinerariifolium]